MSEETLISATTDWYYADKGQQIGPINFEAIKNLITDGKINSKTSVWNGEGDWKSAETTELANLFQRSSFIPPPLTGADIDNKYVWMVVAVPIVGAIIELMVGKPLFWIYWIMNIGLCILDERRLKAAGHDAPKSIWAFFVPIYLWKRATLLQQNKHYVWGWIIAFILSIVLSQVGGKSQIEDTACGIVNESLAGHMDASSSNFVTCEGVKIDKEVSDDFYKATATLSNGKEVPITIKRTGDQILVQEDDQ